MSSSPFTHKAADCAHWLLHYVNEKNYIECVTMMTGSSHAHLGQEDSHRQEAVKWIGTR
jgi:hypothetical protein